MNKIAKTSANPKRKPEQHESNEQTALFRWVAFYRASCPEVDMLYHIPNGGSRHPKEGANLKRQGVRAGVPDLCLPVPRGGFHGLYIEMKYGKNKPTPEQNGWLYALRRQGYAAEVCYGWREAMELITKYLKSGCKA